MFMSEELMTKYLEGVGLALEHISNLSRYAFLSPNRTLLQCFRAVQTFLVLLTDEPPHTDMK